MPNYKVSAGLVIGGTGTLRHIHTTSLWSTAEELRDNLQALGLVVDIEEV